MSLLNPPSRFAAAHTHGPDQNKWQKLLRHALRPELLQTLVDSPSAISRVQPSTTRRVVHAEHVMYEERTLIVLGGSEATTHKPRMRRCCAWKQIPRHLEEH